MVTVNKEVTKQIQERRNLVELANTYLTNIFGRDFKANIAEATYGCTRGPTYYLGNRLGYIAEVQKPKRRLISNIGWFLQKSLPNVRAVQEEDLLFIGRFKNGKGSEIDVLPQYEQQMIQFAEEYEREIEGNVNVSVVEFLDGQDPIHYKNNRVIGSEITY